MAYTSILAGAMTPFSPGSSGVEQRIENPRVGGSIPPPGTTFLNMIISAQHAGKRLRLFLHARTVSHGRARRRYLMCHLMRHFVRHLMRHLMRHRGAGHIGHGRRSRKWRQNERRYHDNSEG